MLTRIAEKENESVQRKLVEDACKIANAHDFITELPEGYDTETGERAGLLSGGQKQRIAIARSIISNPAILLLDEATSALDPHSEGAVQQALDKASKNRTTVVIAHKLATIKNADNIVVMSQGRIVEQGSHYQLLEKDGVYAKLVRIQDLGKNSTSDASQQEDLPALEELSLEKSMTRFSTTPELRLKEQAQKEDYDLHKQM